MDLGVDGNEANVTNRVGSGSYAFELLKQFAKVKNQKVWVYLKESPLPDMPRETENFKYKVFGPKKLWTQFALPLKLTFEQKPDIFFSMGHYGPRFSSVPYVVTIHDLSYLRFPQMFNKDDLKQLTSWSKYSIKNAVHVLAVSKKTKEDIVRYYQIPAPKISVTYEGYDKTRFKPLSKDKVEKTKRKYKISGDYIIFVGTLQPRKNIERLIEAFQIITSSHTPGVSKDPSGHTPGVSQNNLKLVICGKKGWLYDSIFEKVKQLNLEDKIVFTDYVAQVDLPALMAGAKVYVLPSLWEGFGIPVIEAQACGVPVVVSNTSSLPEIVGDSGILVDPESVDSITDGIKKVLTDEKMRSDLIKKGFTNIKRFSWEHCAKETLEILNKVASK